ncbi:SufD family Fe-S cluster assembly protein [Thermaurantiacus sp.]
MRPELPTRRNEAWRWADLRHAEAFAGTPPPANDRLPDTEGLWLRLAGAKSLFVAGQPADAPAAAPAPDRSLPRHPLADLAAASASAGTTLEVAEGADAGTVQLLHIGRGGAAHGVTRVVLGANARLTLVESFADEGADHWLNHRFDAELAAGAELVRVSRSLAGHGLVCDRAAIRMGERSHLVHLSLGLSSASLRAEVEVLLEGPGARAEVDGILLGDGTAALDALTRLHHRVPGTSSRQRWRLVAGGTAQASIAGGVAVARHAQKTDAEQSLKALLLKRSAVVHLKPELEIFADDVACAHGCTVGELDRAALFYLATRGLPPAEAEALLTRAFVADALMALPDELLRDLLDCETQAWLARRTEARP